jgi:tRNA pseudouridine38-40 synthase
VHHLEFFRQGRFIVLDIRANAFLHHMVRNLAGVLMTIGAGERPIEWAGEVLESRLRRTGGVTAHPYGLYLVEVDYPQEFDLPKRFLGPHFLSGLPDCREQLPCVQE